MTSRLVTCSHGVYLMVSLQSAPFVILNGWLSTTNHVSFALQQFK